jgi:hypothetical protein
MLYFISIQLIIYPVKPGLQSPHAGIIFQLLTLYLFIETLCFAGWIAKQGNGSILPAIVFIPLVFLLA